MSRTVLAVAAALLLTTASGCGAGGGAATPPDPALARRTLSEALDAWRAGEPHQAPASRSDPIRVADEQWLAGDRLIDYELGEPEPSAGPSLRLPATLTIEGPRGKAVARQVVYSVTLAPARMVIRQD